MTTKSEEFGLILAKLDKLERMVAGLSGNIPKTSEEAVLRERLDHITVKRHAVLTATLGGVGYQELAKIMQCDVTTVKLHLKGAMNALSVGSRASLLTQHKGLLDPIPEKEYKSRYGLSKRWWLDADETLMEFLTTTKPTANQHTTKV